MTIENIIVEFEIPYLLELEDSFEENPDWRFEVTHNSVEAEFRFMKIVANDDASISRYIRGDRNGLINRTRVQVHFNDNFSRAIPDRTDAESPSDDVGVFYELPGEFSKYVIGYSLDFLNRFLEAYRANLGHHWVKPLGASDILNFEVTTKWENRRADTARYFLGAEPIESLQVDPDTRDNIQDFLSEEQSTNPFKKFDLDAEDNLSKRAYDMTVLNSARLFEVWIKTAYIALMDQRNKKEEDEARRVAIDTGFKSFVEQKFKADTNIDIEHFDEYEEWYEKVWKVRGDVIHDGRRVEEEVANEAYITTKRLLGRLLTEIGHELKGTTLHADVDYP